MPKECPDCEGQGYLICATCSGTGESRNDPKHICMTCKGTGQEKCTTCEGAKTVDLD